MLLGADKIVTFDPTNIVKFDGYSCCIKFSANKMGKKITGNYNRLDTIQNILNSFEEVDLQARNISIDFNSLNNCEKITKFSNYKEYENDFSYTSLSKLTNLKTLELLNGGKITISDVSSLENLTTVKINDPVGDDILTKLPIENLVVLELKNSNITDISPLINAKMLQTLNLTNGIIYDRFSYEGNSNMSSLQVFVNLKNTYNKLDNLFLAGCKNITDWSILEKSGIVWKDWSGFNGR